MDLRRLENLLAIGKRRKLTHVGIEMNQFQHFLADELTRRSNAAGLYLPVRKVTHTSDKLGRIQSLHPQVVNGTLRFSGKHRKLVEQLVQFPFAAHDDGPDALELAIEAARTPRCYVSDPDAYPRYSTTGRKETRLERKTRILNDDDHPTWKVNGRA